jgi:hypothetical protein
MYSGRHGLKAHLRQPSMIHSGTASRDVIEEGRTTGKRDWSPTRV